MDKIHLADPSKLDSIKGFLEGSKKVVFCVGYEGCPPCRGLKAVIKKDSTEYKLVYLDIQIFPEFRQYGMGGVPTWVAYDGDKLQFSGKGFPPFTDKELEAFFRDEFPQRAHKLEEFAESILNAG